MDRTYRRIADHLQYVTIRSADGEVQTLQTTDEHPFHVVGRGWTKAEELREGDRVIRPDDEFGTVVSSIREEHPEGVRVFNLRVENTHSYFVRAEGSDAGPVWVHNTCYDRPSGFRKGIRDEVWEAAIEAKTGRVRDSQTGRFMSKDMPWDMGHKEGFEFWKHQVSAEKRGVTRKPFIDEYNDPSHYRPELPSSNRNHRGEAADNIYLGD